MTLPEPREIDTPPALGGVEHRWAEVNGVRLHWAEAGPTNAPPVVLLHGWPQHWFAWRNQIVDLANDHRVIAPDLRGHGWSEAPEGDYRKQVLVDDLVALLDHLAIDRVDLVGHDWGGWVTHLMAIQHPDRVRRCVTFSIVHPFPRPRLATLRHVWRFWYQWIVATPALGPWAMRHGFVRRLTKGMVADGAMTRDVLNSYDERFRQSARGRAASRLYRTFTFREMPGLVRGGMRDARLVVPTLLVFGTRDAMLHQDLLDLASPDLPTQAPGLEVELVEGAGHFILEERPGLAIDRIRSWLGRPAS